MEREEIDFIMLDLSSGGCRIESPVTVEPGVSLELRIYAPDIEWPLMIEAASAVGKRPDIRVSLLSDHGYGTAALGAGDSYFDGRRSEV
jgi:hypothetical protein